MAKKSFNISSTLSKNKDAQLAPKIPLPKKSKDLEEVEKKVARIHKEDLQAKEVKKERKSSTATSKKQVAKAVKAKAIPEKLVRLTIDTPVEMHRKLKIQSVERGVSMRDYILQLLAKELR